MTGSLTATVLSLALVLSAPAAGAPAATAEDAAAVAARFTEAWNAHDMKSLADLYTDDADFVNVIGLWWRGRDQIRAEHETLHAGRMKQTTLRNDPPAVRLLSPTVAIALVRWELRGDAGAEGWNVGEVRRGILTHVLVLREGRWTIAATQNTDIVDLPNN